MKHHIMPLLFWWLETCALLEKTGNLQASVILRFSALVVDCVFETVIFETVFLKLKKL